MHELTWVRRIRRIEVFDESLDKKTPDPAWAWWLNTLAGLISDVALFGAFLLWAVPSYQTQWGLGYAYVGGISASGFAMASGACYHLGQPAKAKNRLLICVVLLAAFLVVYKLSV